MEARRGRSSRGGARSPARARPRHASRRHRRDVRRRGADRRRSDRRPARRGVPGLEGLPEHASRRGTIEACERSLARLRTDRLDCYLLHWRGRPPLAETIAAFETLQADGKIRSWGVSNFDVEDLDEALAIAGAGRIACNQVLYHLRERAIEHAVLPWCERHRVALVGYTPFGTGRFPGSGARGGALLAEIASAHDATPRQVALRFLTRRPSTFAIPKAASPEHVAENAGAADLRLSPAEIRRIDAAFPRAPRPRSLPTL